MDSMTLADPGTSTGFTRAQFDAIRDADPDRGHRYELIDGAIVVSPGPVTRHQIVSGNLYLLLRQVCPDDLRVLFSPYDVALATDTVVQPDLLVAPRADFSEEDLPGAPLLAVEILSPSTRSIDLGLKKERYERAGCASYWIVDPVAVAITVWGLVEGAYVETYRAEGKEKITVRHPFSVALTPAELLD